MEYRDKVKKFQKFGHCEIKSFLTSKELKTLRFFVQQNLKENNDKTFFLSSRSNKKILNFFTKNKSIHLKLKKLIYNFCKNLEIQYSKKDEIYSVLRVIKNKRIHKESFQFHFDAHLITILVPIIIPKRKKSNNGHLLLSPNLRKIHKLIIINILQKIYYQIILKKIFPTKFLQKWLKFRKIVLKPRSILLFNGYRSLHGNLDIDQRDTRATFLFHYYDLFPNSKLVKVNRFLRIKKENKIISQNLND
jgi:hypothetical protein